MMDLKEIARHFHQKGEEVTPQEVADLLASIANKFRAACPELSDDDEELFRVVLKNTRIQ